jgi:predicted RNA-binding protein with PIN domain
MSQRLAIRQLKQPQSQRLNKAMMVPLTILIDGYNVARNLRGSRLEDGVALATARDNLLAMVKSRFRGTPHRVVVVFDGDGERERREPLKGLPGGQYIFTQRGTSADDVIVRLAALARADGCDVVVCTNDLEVRQNSAPYGATNASVAALNQMLNAPDKHTRKRIEHVSFVRRQLEGAEDEEPKTRPRKGNPRRAPKKQRDQGERTW